MDVSILPPEHILQKRVMADYSLTREQLWEAVTRRLRGVTRTEFEQWLDEGRFDRIDQDGIERFFNSSVSNLIFRHPELEVRRVYLDDSADLERALYKNAMKIQRAARQTGRSWVLPKNLEVEMSVELKPKQVPAGTLVRAWVPVPRTYPHQQLIEWLDTSSPIQALSPPEHSIRSLYMEQPSLGDKPTVFQVRYRYRTWGVSVELDPDSTFYLDPENAARWRPYLQEAAHVQFRPEMVRLAEQIAEEVTHPLLRAWRFYQWISQNIRYSYAPEYSTIPDLAEFCRSRGYGDCGQEAFLFITLCRLSGIPARWQSGWNLFSGAQTIHDWCEIFLAPHGWVPVDPYMGIYAHQYTRHLNPAQREQLAKFYFGGLSQYRMSANCDHQQPLVPNKTSLRSDPVDFQRGELEADGENLYFNQYRYRLNWREVV